MTEDPRDIGLLYVYVRKAASEWEKHHRCSWLGHASYRCGSCRKGFFKVRALFDHDESCPECKMLVVVKTYEHTG